MKIVEKAWGREEWLVNHPDPQGYCCKKLFVEPGYACSLHRHPVKNESFIVLSGAGVIEISNTVRSLRRFVVEEGSIVEVEAGVWHRFHSESGMVLLEVSSFHDDADVERETLSGRIGDTSS